MPGPMANPQTSQSLDNSWHDSGYGVRGEAGIAIRKDFDDAWKDCGEITSIDLTKLEGKPVAVTRGATPIAHSSVHHAVHQHREEQQQADD